MLKGSHPIPMPFSASSFIPLEKAVSQTGLRLWACVPNARSYSTGYVLRPSPALLFFYSTYYGFHADNARLCFYDTGDCLLWQGQTRRGCHDDDFWRDTCCRLTVLGLRGVPDSVREAAISFGANKWYLLTRVDLPLASPSIRAGINQTIMLSLAMVVVASLIGAKGLGEDVLEALQYANIGQGILAGFAILFCAMILDRIVQGERK